MAQMLIAWYRSQVKDLKNRVNDERGADFPSDSLNLIYSGAIMVDDKLIKDYKIDAKKFIVVMKKKEPAAAPTTASPSKSAATESGAAKAAESANSAKKETDPIVATRPSDPVATAAAAAVTASSAAGPVTTSAGSSGAESSIGAEHESLIQNMMELGYSRALVEKALRLSFFNPDVACEHLISERITEANMDQLESDSFALAGVADEYLNFSEGVQVPASSGGGGSAGRRTAASTNPENDPLQFLRAQPQFHQMRQQIQQNPSFLNTVLQQIGVNNPALLKLISENQNAFVEMINEPINNNNNNTNNNRNVSASGAASNISLPAVASATTTAAANPAESMEVVVQEESPRSGAAVNPLTANDDLLGELKILNICFFTLN